MNFPKVPITIEKVKAGMETGDNKGVCKVVVPLAFMTDMGTRGLGILLTTVSRQLPPTSKHQYVVKPGFHSSAVLFVSLCLKAFPFGYPHTLMLQDSEQRECEKGLLCEHGVKTS